MVATLPVNAPPFVWECYTFLEVSLSSNPVLVEWHRSHDVYRVRVGGSVVMSGIGQGEALRLAAHLAMGFSK